MVLHSGFRGQEVHGRLRRRKNAGVGIGRWPINSHIALPVRRGEWAVRRRVAQDGERFVSVALSTFVSQAQFAKARQDFLNIVPCERSFPVFHLDVAAAPIKLHLDIFVVLNLDPTNRQRRCR